MTTIATDGMTRLLDLVSESLDQPDLAPADLAARAYLSRFHFDRLVAAAIGEPPGALRRRLLLERAAYRLVVSNRVVLDVAVEAGYGSHEAFTRAFSRAYGRSPTELRRHPPVTFRELELPCPSDVHFQAPEGLRLPAKTKVNDMVLIQTLVDFHVDVIGKIIERIGAVSNEQLDAPIRLPVEWLDEEPTSLRALVNNLVVQEERWLSAVRGQELPDTSDVSPRGLAARHVAAGPVYRAFVADIIGSGRLADTFVSTDCELPITYTFGGMIMHVVTFGAVRRTIAISALAGTGDESLGWGDPMHVMDEATSAS